MQGVYQNMHLRITLLILLTIPITTLRAQEVIHHDQLVIADAPKDCLACHDGVISINISPCTKLSCLLDPTTSHPTFKQYPPIGKESEFHPRPQVEAAGIVLKNGEVSCISCHNLLNRERFHLVITNDRSHLCRACHIR